MGPTLGGVLKRLWLSTVVASVLLVSGGEADGAFPGANGKIVFTSNEGGRARGLFTIEPDGTGRTNLTRFGEDPAWSPGGRRIAYTEWFQYGSHVAIVNADGTGHFVPADIQTFDSEPSWSPDARKIAFVRHVPDDG